MKEIYLTIMEKALECYSAERLRDFFGSVKKTGLTEHGFPRLAANLGILIAHGRCQEYSDLFCEMMTLCCKQVCNHPKAANDFSVRELCFSIRELQNHKTFPEERIQSWIGDLSELVPETAYTAVAKTPQDSLNNWAIFGAVSEFFRDALCGTDRQDFVDLQLATQLNRFDENGMYKDPNCPMVYDFVSRGLLELLLAGGYRGIHRPVLEELLARPAALSLRLQSVTGELPFGGRSNQCVFNEALLATDYEYQAARLRLSDPVAAASFKAAALFAAQAMLDRMNTSRSHVKNAFPVDEMIGCESYAYFDKYMITAASYAYEAYFLADDRVLPGNLPDRYIASTGPDFHKTVMKGFGYFLEFDTDADPDYDAGGLGRIHKRNCSPFAALSVPFPGKGSHYHTEKPNKKPLSLCPFAETAQGTVSGADPGRNYRLTAQREGKNSLTAVFSSAVKELPKTETCRIDSDGVTLTLTGAENAGFYLPVMAFDGKNESRIEVLPGRISAVFDGTRVTYTFTGKNDGYEIFYNRNGRYRIYKVFTNKVRICLEPDGNQSNT